MRNDPLRAPIKLWWAAFEQRRNLRNPHILNILMYPRKFIPGAGWVCPIQQWAWECDPTWDLGYGWPSHEIDRQNSVNGFCALDLMRSAKPKRRSNDRAAMLS